ncbi:hypothetical protein J25TS5_00240 [Paenibacillus faecis]|uniref:DUF2500 domain-containing protein n=1 Tax=Paenibacillus faecis TaxID=862114 RepID=A0A5D0CVE0_9BACL|nr:DUF2500 domain-containing protein [Paenibacillus faecis]TYA13650.1 DUF2500 domain-containing protein [Paenibacillus faecis]GIO83092.1 hypothetical protein J25TS5_00240 [Paenibacillus faecis]
MQSGVELFGVMNQAIPVFLVIIVGMLLLTGAKGFKRYLSDNRQPVLTVHSIIVGKRTEVSHRHDTDLSVNRSDSTYYLTFEVESGDRLEFVVSGKEYGLCSEGDEGKLTFQGSRYFGFERLKTYRAGLQEYRHY